MTVSLEQWTLFLLKEIASYEARWKKNYIRMIEQISKGNNSEAVNIIAELGTMKAGGVLPDSYPEGSEPDDDYLVLSGIETAEGDRVLLIWTDAEELIVVGKVEGGGDDAR